MALTITQCPNCLKDIKNHSYKSGGKTIKFIEKECLCDLKHKKTKESLKAIITGLQGIHDTIENMRDYDVVCALGGNRSLLDNLIIRIDAKRILDNGLLPQKSINK